MGRRYSLIEITPSIIRRCNFRILTLSTFTVILIFRVTNIYRSGNNIASNPRIFQNASISHTRYPSYPKTVPDKGPLRMSSDKNASTSYLRIEQNASISHTHYSGTSKIVSDKEQSPVLNDENTIIEQNASISHTHYSGTSKIVSDKEQLPVLNDENTIIAMISMGNTRKTFVAERCVRSIRKSGKFLGHIMILTDNRGYIKYNNTLSDDPNTIVLEGRDEDMLPKSGHPPKPIKFGQHVMIYKRFKTLLFDYLNYSPKLGKSIEYIVYIDVDTVVTNDVSIFFQDYHRFVTPLYANRNSSDLSFFAAYRDPGNDERIHSGFMVFHRKHSDGCLNAWREKMETDSEHDSDQMMLQAVLYEDYNRYYCQVYELKTSMMKHFNLAIPTLFQLYSFPTFLHITNTRLRWITDTDHENFIRYALALQPNETLVGNTTWEDLTRKQRWENSDRFQHENTR